MVALFQSQDFGHINFLTIILIDHLITPKSTQFYLINYLFNFQIHPLFFIRSCSCSIWNKILIVKIIFQKVKSSVEEYECQMNKVIFSYLTVMVIKFAQITELQYLIWVRSQCISFTLMKFFYPKFSYSSYFLTLFHSMSKHFFHTLEVLIFELDFINHLFFQSKTYSMFILY